MRPLTMPSTRRSSRCAPSARVMAVVMCKNKGMKPISIIAACTITFSACAKESILYLNYNELVGVMSINPETDLCYWHHDQLSSNNDDTYHHIEYLCFPSANYNGSRFNREISVLSRKSEVLVESEFGKINSVSIVEQ